jgi:hypothetical protein
VNLLLLLIIVNASRTNTEGSKLSRSQRGIGVGDEWQDRDVRELKKQLIPLAVDNLLVALHNLKGLLHDIHALIHVSARGKDTPKYLQDAGVETRNGGGDTTTVGSAGKSGGASTMSPQIIRHCGAKWLMCYILVEFLLGHHLHHVLNIRCKSTRS